MKVLLKIPPETHCLTMKASLRGLEMDIPHETYWTFKQPCKQTRINCVVTITFDVCDT